MPEWKTSAVIASIEKHKGNVAAVARSFGVSRMTVHRYVSEHPTVKAALDDARESMLDNAESVLYKKVLEGSTPELLFFLKTQGKSRGYVERSEVVTEHKWIVEIGELLKQGKVTPLEVEQELGRDLAKELFESIGVSASTGREAKA